MKANLKRIFNVVSGLLVGIIGIYFGVTLISNSNINTSDKDMISIIIGIAAIGYSLFTTILLISSARKTSTKRNSGTETLGLVLLLLFLCGVDLVWGKFLSNLSIMSIAMLVILNFVSIVTVILAFSRNEKD